MAPETILHNIYDEKTDVWALGVLLFEMVFGKIGSKKELFPFSRCTWKS